MIHFVANFEDKFRDIMGTKHKVEVKKELAAKRRAISKTEKRIAELDRLFKSICEDKANSTLNESRFKMLADDYVREQEDLRKSIDTLTAEVDRQKEQSDNLERFIKKVHKHFDLLDKVYTSYAKTAAQIAMRRTCTAAMKASVVLA